MKALTTMLLTLLMSMGAWADSQDEELLRKLIIVETAIDKCIEAKDCFELMKAGGPLVELIYDTDLTDALNKCTGFFKITKCYQVMGRINIKTIEAMGYSIK